MTITTGLEKNMTSCPCCNGVVDISGGNEHCPRCASRVQSRSPKSLQRTTALLFSAVVLYIPANLYPIMTVRQFGSGDAQTIFSGVIHMIESGFMGLAMVVFIASVVVPVLKFLGIGFLIATVHFRWAGSRLAATRVHRIVEMVGRWSMIDIFTIALLVALVQLGFLATVEAGVGAVYFGGVVVLTMLASQTFDPRLLWDTENSR
ncbi:MAG: paraquat-inducible protein A [Rhodopirellula sp.]|nr:paraquat-inducible protein A [Rhodopirellula sp.]